MTPETHSQLANFIWGICNLLRGPYKRNEYRKVILPLTVLRRFDCLLAPTKAQVLTEHAKIKTKPENVVRSLLEKITGRPFYNLSRLDLAKLLDDPNQLAPNLNAYINGFSPNVRAIMERFSFDQQIARMAGKNLLYEVIKAFSKVDLSPERVDNVQMGYVRRADPDRRGAIERGGWGALHAARGDQAHGLNLLLSPEKDLRKSHVVKTILPGLRHGWHAFGGGASTADEILKRAGLVGPRRRRRRVPPHSEPLLHCDGANVLWSADFKGDFVLGDGRRCYPMTDNFSRYLLQCRALERPTWAEVQPWFEWVFREHGLPEAIRTDNGAPFASLAVGGLSRLSAWWIRLGICPERIKPGRPDQNGRHERMHRTLKEAAVAPPAATLEAQQQRFNAFVSEYNGERSHEALERRTPRERYTPRPGVIPRSCRQWSMGLR